TISDIVAEPSPFGEAGVDVKYVLSESIETAVLTVTSSAGEFVREDTVADGNDADQIGQTAGQNLIHWDGLDKDNNLVIEDTYTFTLRVYDLSRNISTGKATAIKDVTPPQVTLVQSATPTPFSPNATPGEQDITSFIYSTLEAVSSRVDIISKLTGATVKSYGPFTGDTTSAEIRWSGTDEAGAFLADGLYQFIITAIDGHGLTAKVTGEVRIDNTPFALSDVNVSNSTFSPQNQDGVKDNAIVSYKVVGADETATIRFEVFRQLTDTSPIVTDATTLTVFPASKFFSWDGKTSGSFVSADAENPYYWKLTAVDEKTHEVRTAAGQFTVDNERPDAPQISNTDNAAQTNLAVTLIGFTAPGATVSASLNGLDSAVATVAASASTGEFSMNLSIPQGNNTLTASAKDAVGNVSRLTGKSQFSLVNAGGYGAAGVKIDSTVQTLPRGSEAALVLFDDVDTRTLVLVVGRDADGAVLYDTLTIDTGAKSGQIVIGSKLFKIFDSVVLAPTRDSDAPTLSDLRANDQIVFFGVDTLAPDADVVSAVQVPSGQTSPFNNAAGSSIRVQGRVPQVVAGKSDLKNVQWRVLRPDNTLTSLQTTSDTAFDPLSDGQDTWAVTIPISTFVNGGEGTYRIQGLGVDNAGNVESSGAAGNDDDLTVIFDQTKPSVSTTTPASVTKTNLTVVDPSAFAHRSSLTQITITPSDALSGVDTRLFTEIAGGARIRLLEDLDRDAIEDDGDLNVGGIVTASGADLIFTPVIPLPSNGTKDDTYIIRITMQDRAKNAVEDTRIFILDTTKPFSTASYRNDDPTKTLSATTYINDFVDSIVVYLADTSASGYVGGVDTDNSTVLSLTNLTTGGSVNGTLTKRNEKFYYKLADSTPAAGVYQLLVFARDRNGNSDTIDIRFVFDQETSSIKITPDTGAIVNTLSSVRVDLADTPSGISGEAGQSPTFRWYWDENGDGTFSDAELGTQFNINTDTSVFSLGRSTDGAQDGFYALVVSVTDRAGNNREDTVVVLYDTVKPRVQNYILSHGLAAVENEDTFFAGEVFGDSIIFVGVDLEDTNTSPSGDTSGITGFATAESTYVILRNPAGQSLGTVKSQAGTDTIGVVLTGGSIIDKEAEVGTYTLTIQAVDRAGNYLYDTVVFVFDRDKPQARIVNPLNNTQFNVNPIALTGIASDTTSTVGRVFVRVFAPTSPYGAVYTKVNDSQAAGTSNWNYTLNFSDSRFVPGVWKIDAYAVDNAGNTGPASDSVNVTFDTSVADVIAPVVSDIVATPSPFGNDGLDVKYVISENVETAILYILDAGGNILDTEPSATGIRQTAGQNLIHWNGQDKNGDIVVEGTYTFEVRVMDLARNVATGKATAVKDVTPPSVTLVQSASPNPFSPSTSIGKDDVTTFTYATAGATSHRVDIVSKNTGATVKVFGPFTGDTTGNVIEWDGSSQADGAYRYVITAVDNNGLARELSGEVIIDNTPFALTDVSVAVPLISPQRADGRLDQTFITYKVDGASNTATVIFEVFASQTDSDPVFKPAPTTLVVFPASKFISWNGTDDAGNVLTQNDERIYYWKITAVDEVTKEVKTAAGQVIVDNKIPEAPSITEQDFATTLTSVSISGFGEAAGSVFPVAGLYQVGTISSSGLPASAIGAYSGNVAISLSGVNEVSGIAEDLAGNRSRPDSATFKFDGGQRITHADSVSSVLPVTLPRATELYAIASNLSGTVQINIRGGTQEDTVLITVAAAAGRKTTSKKFSQIDTIVISSGEETVSIELKPNDQFLYVTADFSAPVTVLTGVNKEATPPSAPTIFLNGANIPIFGDTDIAVAGTAADVGGGSVVENTVRITRPGGSKIEFKGNNLVNNTASKTAFKYLIDTGGIVSTSGIYTVEIFSTDDAGNIETPTDSEQFLFDANPPTLAGSSPTAGERVNKQISSVTITVADDFGVATQSANTKLELFYDVGTDTARIDTDDIQKGFSSIRSVNGNAITYNLLIPLSTTGSQDGLYIARHTLSDSAGNVTSADSFTFFYDVTVPQPLTVFLNDADTISWSSPSQIKVFGPSAAVDNIFAVTAFLTDTSNLASIQLYNNNQFNGGIDELTSREKTNVQNITIATELGATRRSSTDSITLRFTNPVNTAAENGEYNINIVAVDDNGNESTYIRKFRYDSVGPKVDSLSPDSGSITNKLVFTYKVSDGLTGVDTTLSKVRLVTDLNNNGIFGDLGDGAGSPAEYTISTEGRTDTFTLSDKARVAVVFRLFDQAGNLTEDTRGPIIFDDTAPRVLSVKVREAGVEADIKSTPPYGKSIDRIVVQVSDSYPALTSPAPPTGGETTLTTVTLRTSAGVIRATGSNPTTGYTADTILLDLTSNPIDKISESDTYTLTVITQDLAGNYDTRTFVFVFQSELQITDLSPTSIDDSSPAIAFWGLNMIGTSFKTFQAVTIQADTNMNAILLPALIKNGSAIYRDNGTTEGIFDAADAPVPLGGNPTWTLNAATGRYEITLALSMPEPIPTIDSGAEAGDDYYVVFRTSENTTPGDSFILNIPAKGVQFSDGASDEADTSNLVRILPKLLMSDSTVTGDSMGPGELKRVFNINTSDLGRGLRLDSIVVTVAPVANFTIQDLASVEIWIDSGAQDTGTFSQAADSLIVSVASNPTNAKLNASGNYEYTLRIPAASRAIPEDDSDSNADADYYVVIRTSNSLSVGDQFKVSIAAGGVNFDSGASRKEITGRSINATTAADLTPPVLSISFPAVNTILTNNVDAQVNTPQAEIFFVIDVTGSMQPSINNVRDNVTAFATQISQAGIQFKLGLVAYRDVDVDNPAIINRGLTSDVNTFKNNVSDLGASGGGDLPESALEGVLAAVNTLSPGSKPFIILITDAEAINLGDEENGKHRISDVGDTLVKLGIITYLVTDTAGFAGQSELFPLADRTGGLKADISGQFSTLLSKIGDAIITAVGSNDRLARVEASARDNVKVTAVRYRYTNMATGVPSAFFNFPITPSDFFTFKIQASAIGLADGEYLFDVTASDGTGGEDTRTARFTMDSTRPKTTLTVRDDSGSLRIYGLADATPSPRGLVSSVSSVQVSLDGGINFIKASISGDGIDNDSDGLTDEESPDSVNVNDDWAGLFTDSNAGGDFWADDPAGIAGVFEPGIDEVFAMDVRDSAPVRYTGANAVLFAGKTPGVQTPLGAELFPLIDEDMGRGTLADSQARWTHYVNIQAKAGQSVLLRVVDIAGNITDSVFTVAATPKAQMVSVAPAVIDVASDAIAVLGINVTGEATRTFQGVTVESNLDLDTILLPVNGTHGAALYMDNGSIPGVYDVGDVRMTVSGSPTWTPTGTGRFSLTLSPIAPQPVPATDVGGDSGPDFFVVIKTSPGARYADTFFLDIPAGAIQFSDGLNPSGGRSSDITVLPRVVLSTIMAGGAADTIAPHETKAVLALDIDDTGLGARLVAVTVTIVDDVNFNLSDLERVSFWQDNHVATDTGVFNALADSLVVSLASRPDTVELTTDAASGRPAYRFKLLMPNPMPLPPTNRDTYAGADFYVVLHSSGGISFGDKLKVRIEAGRIEFDSGASRKSAATATITADSTLLDVTNIRTNLISEIVSPAKGSIVNDTRVLVTGFAQDLSTDQSGIALVRVGIKGPADAAYKFVSATGTTNWSVLLNLTKQGVHSFVSQAFDFAGFVSLITDTTTVTIDTTITDVTPPLITNIQATPNPFSPNNDGINDKTVISFTVNENCTASATIAAVSPGVIIPAGIDTRLMTNQPQLIGPNSFNFSGVGFPEGSYKVTITAVDNAGNVAIAQSATIKIDLKPPKITDVSVVPDPINPAGLNDKATIQFRVSDIGTAIEIGEESYAVRFVSSNSLGEVFFEDSLGRFFDNSEPNFVKKNAIPDSGSDLIIIVNQEVRNGVRVVVRGTDPFGNLIRSNTIEIPSNTPPGATFSVGKIFQTVEVLSVTLINKTISVQENVTLEVRTRIGAGSLSIESQSGAKVTDLFVSPGFSGDGVYQATWSPSSSQADGIYTFRIRAIDAGGNFVEYFGPITVDKTDLTVTNVTVSPPSYTLTSFPQEISLSYTLSKPAQATLRILNDTGVIVRSLQVDNSQIAKGYTDVWNVKNDTGNTVVAGNYSFVLFVFDKLTNKSVQIKQTVEVKDPSLIVDDVAPISSIVKPNAASVFGASDSAVSIAGSSVDNDNDTVSRVTLSFFRTDLGVDIPLNVNGTVSNQITILWGSSDFTDNYSWTKTVTFPISAQEATVKVTALARDVEGNAESPGALNTVSFKIDLLNFATVAITSPNPGLGPFKTTSQTIDITASASSGGDLEITSMRLYRGADLVTEVAVTGGVAQFSKVPLGATNTDTFAVVGIDSKGNKTAQSASLTVIKEGLGVQITCPDGKVHTEPAFNCGEGDKVAITVPQGVTNAQMKVFGIGGQQMASIKQEGDQLIWDGKKESGGFVKNGVYLMRVEMGGRVQIVPIAVVK
ncbi:VWA domain-containing protein, partial [bacterium]|nr:VWA domain-containing protein [bacterium]